MRRRTTTRGFTLVEVLVTIAIMSMVMVALQYSLQSTMLTHDTVAIEIASVREGPKILDMIERDIRSLHCYNMEKELIFRGKEESHMGARGDRIDLVSSINSATRVQDPESPNSAPQMISSDVNEVGYRVRPHPVMDDFLELYRREDLFLDEEPLEGGRYELLHDKVTTFQITYIDQLGDDGEEEDEWDMEERGVLPAAVRIYIQLQSSPDLVGGFATSEALAQRLHEYTRVVPIAPEQNETRRIRPVIPTKILAGAPGGGMPGGDGTGGGATLGGMDPGGGGGGNGPGPAGGVFDGPKFEVGNLPDAPFGRGRSGGNPGSFNIAGGSGDDLGLNPSEQEILDLFLDEYRSKYGSGDDPDNPFGGIR
jgi:type II secretion system protein J